MRLTVVEGAPEERLWEVLGEAAHQVDERTVRWVQLGEKLPPDAVVRDVRATLRGYPPMYWDKVPFLGLRLSDGAAVQIGRLGAETVFDLRTATRHERVKAISDWLRGQVVTVPTDVREQLEALVSELRTQLQECDLRNADPEEVAQATAAVETMEIQLRAPRMSKQVLKWAASQIPPFMIGVMSGYGQQALNHFIHF